jgi:hypothetical protein
MALLQASRTLSKAVALDTVRFGREGRDGLVVVPLVDKGRNPGAS